MRSAEFALVAWRQVFHAEAFHRPGDAETIIAPVRAKKIRCAMRDFRRSFPLTFRRRRRCESLSNQMRREHDNFFRRLRGLPPLEHDPRRVGTFAKTHLRHRQRQPL